MIKFKKSTNADNLNKYTFIDSGSIFEIFKTNDNDIFWTFFTLLRKTEIAIESDHKAYPAFKQLMTDVRDGNFYKNPSFDNKNRDFIESDEYKIMYNAKKDRIRWYSDDRVISHADVVEIKQEKNRIVIKFIKNENVNDYGSIHIRFKNFGSRYSFCYEFFKRLYEDLNLLNSDIATDIILEKATNIQVAYK